MPSSMYSADSSGGLRVSGEYDPGITEEIDRKIRNLPIVVTHCEARANDLKSATGSSNFEVIVSHDSNNSRPRAYVAPSNNQGIHEELSQAILLKAALGMDGK